MRVSYNLFDQVPGEGRSSGVYQYCKGLLGALARERPDVEQILFVNALNRKEFERISPSATFETVPLNPRSRVARTYWEQVLYPLRVRRYRPDIVHSLQYTTPLMLAGRSVVTIHDGVHFFYAREYRRVLTLAMRYYWLFESLFARHYGCVLADSAFTKSEIETLMHVRRERVVAVHLAPSNVSNVPERSADDFGKPLLLTIASSALHKNTVQVVEALGVLVNEHGVDARLVIVGNLRRESDPICVSVGDINRAAQVAGVSERCLVTGFLPEAELLLLMSRAAIVVFPTLYEGFGIPVVEAMASGIPVACSRIPTLVEVCGDAVTYFDPASATDMAEQLARVLEDAPRRERLVAVGRARAAEYTWERCARETAAVYDRFLGRS